MNKNECIAKKKNMCTSWVMFNVSKLEVSTPCTFLVLRIYTQTFTRYAFNNIDMDVPELPLGGVGDFYGHFLPPIIQGVLYFDGLSGGHLFSTLGRWAGFFCKTFS